MTYVVIWVKENPICTLFFALGKKVWDDVAEHSREFIQEYLEEFPAVSVLYM